MEMRDDLINEVGIKLTDILDNSELEIAEAIVLLTSVLAYIHRRGLDMPPDIFWKTVFNNGMRFSDDLEDKGVPYDG